MNTQTLLIQNRIKLSVLSKFAYINIEFTLTDKYKLHLYEQGLSIIYSTIIYGLRYSLSYSSYEELPILLLCPYL